MNKIKEMLHSVTRRMGGEAKAKRIAMISIVAVILVTLVSATFIINTSDDSIAERQFTEGNFRYGVVDEAQHTVRILGPVNKGLVGPTVYIDSVTETESGIVFKIVGIAGGAFSGCTDLITVTMGTYVGYIEGKAFQDCTSLTSVTIGTEVTEISDSVFKNTKITDVNIPAKVSNIYPSAFNDCKTLKTITVDSSNKKYLSEDGILFNKAKYELITYPEGKPIADDYVVPIGIKAIGPFAFYGLGFKTIGMMEVNTIGNNAFENCTNLTSVAIPEPVSSIEFQTFKGCTSLASVYIPDGVQFIGDNSFSGCSKLTDVIIKGKLSAGNTVFSKYFCNGVWGLPGSLGKEKLTLDLNISCKWNMGKITTKNGGTIAFGIDAKSTTDGPFVTSESGYNISGADRAGFTFTCTDKWKAPANVYGVRFNGNGSTEGSMDDQIFTNGEKALHSNTFKRTGYTFAGWSITEGGQTVYYDGDTINPSSDMSLHAVWDPVDRLLTFDSNGGTGNMEKQIFKNDVPQNLSKNLFIRDGYKFAGWSTTRGGPLVYGDGVQITLTDDITLYAVWIGNDHKITFDPNGGTVKPTSKDVTVGSPIGELPIPTKYGHKFMGWQIDGMDITSETIWTVDSDKTAIAQWNTGSYTVTLDLKGGSPQGGTPAGWTLKDGKYTKDFDYEKTYEEILAIFGVVTKTGYTFSGWDPSTGTVKETGNNISATWTINKYTITPTAGDHGKIDPSGKVTVEYGGSKKFTFDPNPGYDIADVKIDGISDPTLVTAGHYTFSDVKVDHTIEVIFEPCVHILTFDAKGGTPEPGPMNVKHDLPVGKLPVVTKDGFIFMGWYIKDVRIDENYVWVFDGDQKATAVWGHAVTASSGKGGSMSQDGKVLVADSTDKTFTIKADKGFKIKDVTVDGVSVGAVSTYTFSKVTGDHTINAEFERTSPAPPGPVNPTNSDPNAVLYLGFGAFIIVLLGSLVAVIFKLRK